MLIGGFQPLTLLDFPGYVACIVFTVGCNMRCGYCHNPHLVLPKWRRKQDDVSEERFFSFLDSRRSLLDGVVISGGEPTVQPDLIDFIRKIKTRGFLVKLDTNGTRPEIVSKLLEEKLLDYIAMDIKHIPEKYETACGGRVDTDAIGRTKELILRSGIDHEFRTTVIPTLHTEEDIAAIARSCKGCRKYTLQGFRPRTPLLDPHFETLPSSSEAELRKFQEIAGRDLPNVQLLN